MPTEQFVDMTRHLSVEFSMWAFYSMRHPPKLVYSGLTIILSNPSRFDTKELLSANGGSLFCNDILYKQGINRYQCDIRLAVDKSPLIAGTKVVLLLGETSLRLWLPTSVVKDNTINELRGSPYKIDNIIYVPSYLPQDCVDKQNYESRLNPLAYDANEMEVMEREDKDVMSAKKRKANTLRSNYAFWLQADVAKAIRLLNNPTLLDNEPETKYHYYLNSNDIINKLRQHQNKFLYFDCETAHDLGITVFAFAYDINDVYIVPLVKHDYSLAYDKMASCKILQALASAIKNNIIVAHNGAAFDCLVLAHRYKIPCYRVYDTMVAHHRCYPLVERSLGHCVSYWTNETYHKDESNFKFGNAQQHKDNCLYCGKDVSTMVRIHLAQESYIDTVKGLRASVQQAMSSIVPYLTTTLQGIRYRIDKIVDTLSENDRLMTQYLRMIKLLVGEKAYSTLKTKSKKPLPSSNSQCVTYFHDMLNYAVVTRSKKTRKPSLAEESMLKLKLKYNNPVIDLILAYRKTQKESSTIQFTPWKI